MHNPKIPGGREQGDSPLRSTAQFSCEEREVRIAHAGHVYRLQPTRNHKLFPNAHGFINEKARRSRPLTERGRTKNHPRSRDGASK